jgi:hypothetical protein
MHALPTHVDVALRRFDMAYERERLEDRLIDYWVGLEALFLPDRQELSYKAGMRIARYVGGNPVRRREIFEDMRASYSLRSEIVHGEPLKSDMATVVAKTEDVLREALFKIATCDRPVDVKKLAKELDAEIASGGS